MILLYLLIREKTSWKRTGKIILTLLVVLIIDVCFITALVNIKLPSKEGGGGISAASLIKERVTTTEEAAIGSRFQLLKPLLNKYLEKPIIGAGFGTTVTYTTEDPRSKQQNNGLYTTYSFEWGYLDVLVKIGAVGLLVYLFFIGKILTLELHLKFADIYIFLFVAFFVY